MRRLILTSILVLSALALIGVSQEALSQRPLSELGPFPSPYDGLELHLEAVKDTFLIGEPILAEVTLINASDRPISDPCLFLPGFYPFSVIAVESESSLTWLEPALLGSMLFRDLVLPPGGCVETAVLAGARGVLSEGSRGPALFITQCCTIPGTYAFMARYHHVAERDSSRRVLEEGTVVSGLDSFYVKVPPGLGAVTESGGLLG